MSLSGVALVWSAAAVILIFREMARVKREKQGLGAPVRRAPLLQGPEVAEGALSVAVEGGELSHAPEPRGQLMKSTH